MTEAERFVSSQSSGGMSEAQRFVQSMAAGLSADSTGAPGSPPPPSKRLGTGDFRQIERGGYTGEPMGVGDLRYIERDESGVRVPQDNTSLLNPAGVFRGAVSGLTTLGDRGMKAFVDPVVEKNLRMNQVMEPSPERFSTRLTGVYPGKIARFLTAGVPDFANRFVNPEEYGSTVGRQASEAGVGLVSGVAKAPAQFGEELHQTSRDFGVQGEENPMKAVYHDLGADKTFEEGVSEYNQDPSGWLQTAMIAKGVWSGGLRAAKKGFDIGRRSVQGFRQGLREAKSVPVEPKVADTRQPVDMLEQTLPVEPQLGRGMGAEGSSKGITPGVDVGETSLPFIQTPKATTGVPEVRAIKEAPLATLQGEVRQMGRIPEDKLNTLTRSDLEYVVSGGRIGRPSKTLLALGIAGITATGAYYLTNPDDRKDVASAALGMGVFGAGLMRKPLKEGGGRRLTAKEMRADRALRQTTVERSIEKLPGQEVGAKTMPAPPKLTGKETPGDVNLNRMNYSPEERAFAQRSVEKFRPFVEKIKGGKVTDQEVIDLAQEHGMVQQAISRDAELKLNAQVLNSRMNEAKVLSTIQTDRLSPFQFSQFIEQIRNVESIKTMFGRGLQKLSIDVDPAMQTTHGVVLRKLLNEKDPVTGEHAFNATDLVSKYEEWQGQGKDFRDPRVVVEFYREFVKPNKREILDEYRYINMLSSPNTHIVNMASNILQGTVLRPGTRLVSGGVDFIGSKLTGRSRKYYASSVGPYTKGFLNALPDAFQAVREVMSGKRQVLRPDLEHIPTLSKYTKWGQPVTRALEAGDVFMRTLVERAEIEALVHEAKKKGTPIDMENITAEAQLTASKVVFRGELDLSNASGQGMALSKIDGLASGLMGTRRAVPELGWLVPFVVTPLNIAKQGIEYSPAGFFTMIKSGDKTMAFSKALIGSSVWAGSAYLAAQGLTTWKAPAFGTLARKEWDQNNMKEYAVKIGDKWYSYSKLGPLAYPLALAASMKYSFKNNPSVLTDDVTKKLIRGFGGMAEFFSDQSYVQSLGDILDATKNISSGEWEGNVAQLVGGTARQVIPLSALQGWVNGIIDPIQRKNVRGLTPEAILQNLQRNWIGMSVNLEAKENAEGGPLEKSLPIGNALSPFQMAPANPAKEQTYRENRIAEQAQKAIDKIVNTIDAGDTKLAEQMYNLLKENWGKDIPPYSEFELKVQKRQLDRLKSDLRKDIERPKKPGTLQLGASGID